MIVGQSCEKWLDVKDFDKISLEESWQTKEFVDGMVAGAYRRLQTNAATDIFYWGELRGDCLIRNTSFSGDDAWVENVREVKDLEISDVNTFANYADLYSVINRCNQVIEYAPGVLNIDDTYTSELCKQQIAEMKWLRCLCYFYLVRAFRDVPYVTEAYMDDKKPFAIAKTDGMEILRKLAAELEDITRPRTETDEGGWLIPDRKGAKWLSKGRGTALAGFAMLADIYLWLEDYDKAIIYCEKILNNEQSLDNPDGILQLVRTFTGKTEQGILLGVNDAAWYNQIFATGNSTESIFEIEWVGTQVSPILEQLYHKDGIGKSRLLVPARLGHNQTGKLYGTNAGVSGQGLRHVRDDVRSIRYDAAGTRVWKYSTTSAGSTSGRADTDRDVNFIVYRLTEIYLMKAEALIMKEEGNVENYTAAYDLINTIRERGGFDAPHPALFTTELEGLEYLLLERQREFLAEGKRWFDLVRIALKKDAQYKDLLINILVEDIPAQNRDIYRGKLQDPYGYFFPIHKDEIDSSGGVLTQNEYYN